ncbi:MAG: hypothetical protein ACKORB_09105 [Opitutia bacterium]|jgi:hypothetical protein
MELFVHLLPLFIALAVAVILVWAVCAGMSFAVDGSHVRVRMCGFTVRKVALADIEWADRRWDFWNEHYAVSLRPSRVVRLRRRTGLFRSFIITPPDADSFVALLRERGIVIRP